MTKPSKTDVFKDPKPKETVMDKTTRAAWEILDEETERREVKTARLRKARLEREGGTPAPAPKPSGRT